MDGDEEDENDREKDAVKDVEAEEGVLGDDVSSQEEKADLLADERRLPGHVRPDRDAPERELVPRKEVARVREKEGDEKEDDADHPVELARGTIGPVVEDPQHVEHRRKDHQVGGPPVEIPEEQAVVDDESQLLHVPVGLRDGGVVVEHQEDSRHDQDERRDQRHPSEPEGVGEAERLLADLHGMDVEEEVLEDDERPVPVRPLRAVPDDRAPDGRRAKPVEKRTLEACAHVFSTFPRGMTTLVSTTRFPAVVELHLEPGERTRGRAVRHVSLEVEAAPVAGTRNGALVRDVPGDATQMGANGRQRVDPAVSADDVGLPFAVEADGSVGVVERAPGAEGRRGLEEDFRIEKIQRHDARARRGHGAGAHPDPREDVTAGRLAGVDRHFLRRVLGQVRHGPPP